MRLTLLLIAIQIAFVAFAIHIDDNKKQIITQFMNSYMKNNSLVGSALSLVNQGEIIWNQGFGYADKEQQIQVLSNETLFRWASMSKQITSMVALRLHEQGLIDLDIDISNYISYYEVPENFTILCEQGQQSISFNNTLYECTDPQSAQNNFAFVPIQQDKRTITLRMLLSHFSGIQHYSNGKGNPVPPVELANSSIYNTGIEWAIQYFIHNPLATLPNTTFNYTTFGFDLAGVVIEKAINASFEDIARALIVEPAQMSSMTSDKEWLARFRKNRAQGYIDGVNKSQESDVSYKLPGGGWISTVEDLGRFVAHFRNESLLSNQMKQLAWTPYNPNFPNYGLGFFIIPYNQQNQYFVGHNGAQDKTRTEVRYYIDEDFGIAFMTNSENANTGEICNLLVDIIKSDIVNETLFK